jgi:hypothetical protein
MSKYRLLSKQSGPTRLLNRVTIMSSKSNTSSPGLKPDTPLFEGRVPRLAMHSGCLQALLFFDKRLKSLISLSHPGKSRGNFGASPMIRTKFSDARTVSGMVRRTPVPGMNFDHEAV